MKAIKPIKNIEELKDVQEREIIGIWQLTSAPIPTSVEENDGEKMRLLGNIEGIIIEYNFPISCVKGFDADGSIIFPRDKDSRNYFEPENPGYEQRKKILIERRIWD